MGACGARRRSALWHPARALIAAALLFAGSARAIENKCSACRQIARRLHESSTDDKPRNALDMRSRLNSEGRREGRMIAYRESELAVHEVVDELCEGMTGYVLVGGEWQNGKKVLPPPQSGVDKQVRKRQEKEFAYFCGTLLEKHEDAIVQHVKGIGGAFEETEAAICSSIAAHCDVGTRAEL